MAKSKFNHKLESTAEACGLDEETMDAKFASVVEDKIQNDDEVDCYSKMVEVLENSFNKRELSFILASKMMSEAHQGSRSSNPLAELLEMLGAE